MNSSTSAKDFWIVKGNKNYPTPWDSRTGDIQRMIDSGLGQLPWGTKRRIPEEFKKGDGVFYWSSSPDCFVIGLGTVLDPFLGQADGFNRFLLSFYGFRLYPNALLSRLRDELPLQADGQMASFLRAAVVQTIYALTQQQATCLARIITANTRNRMNTEPIFREWGLLQAAGPRV